MDELHLENTFECSRMLRDFLHSSDLTTIGRKRVQTLMRLMGIEAFYRNPTLVSDSQASSLSLSVAWSDRPSFKPCLTSRYNLHSHAARLCVSVCGGRLGHSSSIFLAAIQYTHHRFLHGSREWGDSEIRLCIPVMLSSHSSSMEHIILFNW